MVLNLALACVRHAFARPPNDITTPPRLDCPVIPNGCLRGDVPGSTLRRQAARVPLRSYLRTAAVVFRALLPGTGGQTAPCG